MCKLCQEIYIYFTHSRSIENGNSLENGNSILQDPYENIVRDLCSNECKVYPANNPFDARVPANSTKLKPTRLYRAGKASKYNIVIRKEFG